MCGTIHLIIFAATVDIHTGDGSIITQMDYFTLAVSRLDHGLNTFLLSMDVLFNACIPIILTHRDYQLQIKFLIKLI